MRVLGIESSCDETAAAVVADGNRIMASVVASQVAVHHPYGGVVPELAARRHMEAVVVVVESAIQEAGAEGIDGVAVTQGPGLVGALLVGFSFARAFAYARNLPWIGVNHLHGHINSVFLLADPPPFPFVSLLASGGHTALYYVRSHTDMELMGQTLDDAAGEAYDKVAKVLGLGYPGGGIIDETAQKGLTDPIPFPRSYLDKSGFDFSFSGIKTAVNRYVQTHPDSYAEAIPQIAAGFQESVTDVLADKLIWAARARNCAHVCVVGGVAANQRLGEKVRQRAQDGGMAVHIPPPRLCGDNAAMIAAAGYHYLKAGQTAPLDSDVYSRVR